MAQNTETVNMESTKVPVALFGSESQKLKLGSLAFSCYLLDNGQRVLLKNSIPKVFGYDGKSENWLFEFLMHINRLTPVEPVILEALGRDIVFQVKSGESLSKKLGISPNLFLEACRTVVQANNGGFLYMSELRFAKAAENVIKEVADADIEQLIDNATGYELYKQNHKDALARYMSGNDQSYGIWVKSFPDSFFRTVFLHKGWGWKNLNSDAVAFAAFLNNVVFSRIPHDLMVELQDSKPKMQYRKKNTPERYIEHPDLRAYLQAISSLMTASDNSDMIFEQMLSRAYPQIRNILDTSAKKDAGQNADAFIMFNDSIQKAFHRKK